MIEQALGLMATRLNKYLQPEGASRDKVVVSRLVSPEGTAVPEIANKLVLSLVNVQYAPDVSDAAAGAKATSGERKTQPGAPSDRSDWNLLVMVASNFDDYATELRSLSEAILCFQSNPVLNWDDSLEGDAEFDNLFLNLAEVDPTHLSHLWSQLGVKAVSSALFVARLRPNPRVEVG